jgi:hypothetical protein
MSANPAPITNLPAARRSAWLGFAPNGLDFLRRLLLRRLQSDKSLEALAALGDVDLHCLSESGQTLRREARRAREISRRCAAVAGWLSAGAGLLASGTGLAAEQVCRPAVTIAQARLSDVDGATAARRWTALISIDSSRCAPGASGSFQLVLLRLKENGPDLPFRPFREGLPWQGPATKAEVPFSADEAVGRAWIEDVSPCACVP